MKKTKLQIYRELIKTQSQKNTQPIKISEISGGSNKILTQEEKDKKKNVTIIKTDENKTQPIKNKISDEKLKKFINFRL